MKSRQLDQFYTKKEVALKYYQITDSFLQKNHIEIDMWLEPSAGTGAFYNLLPINKIGIDLEPKIENVIEHDFLTYILEDKRYVTIGNPPFGKNSSLAIKFFNKCAEKSEVIAFILPKTFKKDSVINKLNKNFALCFEEQLDQNSFLYNNEDYDVPCVFQIWKKENIERTMIKNDLTHIDFIFTTKDNADFAVQRVGANAGKLKIDFSKYAQSSHYFIKTNADIKQEVIKIFENIDYKAVKYNTAGNPSISKTEMIKLYKEQKNK